MTRPAARRRSRRIGLALSLAALAVAGLGAEAIHAGLGDGRSIPAQRTSPVQTWRGTLSDRNGQVLAVSTTAYGLSFNAAMVPDAGKARRTLLAALPRIPARRLDLAFANRRWTYLIGGLSPAERMGLEHAGLPGLRFLADVRRIHPQGRVAAHLVGLTETGGRGLSGAERALDRRLAAAGPKAPPVALSLDLRIQSVLERELAAASRSYGTKGAAGVVVDVQSGEILALASSPGFDPAAPGKAATGALTDRAAASLFEPGAISDVFTTAMALDAGLVRLDTPVDVRSPLRIGRYEIHGLPSHAGEATAADLFIQSSGIGMARLGLAAGASRMERYWRGFGLYDAAPIELAESARPLTPPKLTPIAVAAMSFGRGIAISPLTFASALTAAVNGGRAIPLTILKRAPGAWPAGRRVIAETTSRSLLDLLRLNVVKGTGVLAEAAAPGLRVGGKTGTAEKAIAGGYSRSRVTASFAAVFPTDGPPATRRFLMLVVLDEPKPTSRSHGLTAASFTAAPLAGRVINQIAPFVGVARESRSTHGEENRSNGASRSLGS